MSGLFGGGSVPRPPKPQPPAPMPDPESPEVLEARRREAAEILSRGGRRSTILASASQSAGVNFDSYDRPKLGAAR